MVLKLARVRKMKGLANGAAAHEGEFGLEWLPCPCLPPACGLFDACVVDGDGSVERKAINPELWHACAGPLVTLPLVGSLVVYFPQGHSEQVKIKGKTRGSCLFGHGRLF